MKAPVLSPLDTSFMPHWEVWYPGVPPVGFLLREAFPDRWLRLHALAESKRRPRSGRDYAELQRRLNTAAEDVLGPAARCALIVLHECGSAIDRELARMHVRAGDLADLGPLPEQLWDERNGVFAVPMCLHGAEIVWHRGLLDGFFSAAADDRLKSLLVERERGQVFAPYDGGVDIIFASKWERDEAAVRYQSWLSSRADGL